MRKYDLNSLLKSYITGGIIAVDDVLAGKETAVNKILKNVHPYEIYFSESKSVWETYIASPSGRKRVQRKSREDLEAFLLDHYKGEKFDASFEDLYDEFMEYKSKLVKGTTINAYIKSYKKHYANAPITKKPLSKITIPEMESWLADTIRTYDMDYKAFHKFSVLFAQMYEWAVRQKYVTENPFLYIDYKKLNMRKARRKKSTEKAFSKTESKDICEVAFEDFKRGKDCVPLAVAFTFHTGLRSGEVVALKWEDVNLDNKTMVVQRLERQYQVTDDFRKLGKHIYEIEEDTKGSFGDRPIELSDKAVEILLELKDFYKKKGIESEWIFTHKTEKIHYRAIDLRIRKYCETAGISIKSMHKCRATFVSILRDAGMSFEKIAEIVGHKQIQTTMNNYSYDVSTDEENRKMLNEALDF